MIFKAPDERNTLKDIVKKVGVVWEKGKRIVGTPSHMR